MFYLQRDGQWIDEVPGRTRPDSEGGDVLFESSAEALELLGRLRGKPVVRDLPVSKDDVKNYLARVGSGSSPQELLRRIFARYRAAKGKPHTSRNLSWQRLCRENLPNDPPSVCWNRLTASPKSSSA